MTKESIRTLLVARPFTPLRLTTSEGGKYDIPNPDCLFVPPDSAGNVVLVVQQSGRISMVKVDKIEKIEKDDALHQKAPTSAVCE